jgi:hypothetical protein
MKPTLAPVARLGPFVFVLAGLTWWAITTRTWMAAPLAIAFVVTAFWWHIHRVGSARTGADLAAPGGLCTGCAAGCVECRERIEPEEAA